MCIDILQHLILFVDPRKTESEGNRRRMWFELVKKPKHVVKSSIQKLQVKKGREKGLGLIVRTIKIELIFAKLERITRIGFIDPFHGKACLLSEQRCPYESARGRSVRFYVVNLTLDIISCKNIAGCSRKFSPSQSAEICKAEIPQCALIWNFFMTESKKKPLKHF